MLMSKEDIVASIRAKKALMEAEKNRKEVKRGKMHYSYVDAGQPRNEFEALSNIKTRVSGKKYASDTLVSKYGRV